MSRISHRLGALALSLYIINPVILAQPQKNLAAPSVGEPPDAERTKQELSRLLSHYPPTLRRVLAIDPSLLANQPFLAPYPALAAFLTTHPEIVRSPAFYIEDFADRRIRQDDSTPSERMWSRVESDMSVAFGFAMALGALIWLIRTIIDYRRWNRLSKIQTDIHTKLLDRFTGNEELLAYIQSPAGSKFLESSPITLDPGPRTIGAPMGRILWSVQAGIVAVAAGMGLEAIAVRFPDHVAQPFRAFGILAIALGFGFALSAIVSFAISRRLGLIEQKLLESK